MASVQMTPSQFHTEIERDGARHEMDDVVGHTRVHANQSGGDQADQPAHDEENPSVRCSLLNHNVPFISVFSVREWTASILAANGFFDFAAAL
jgi:hypothetical protein